MRFKVGDTVRIVDNGVNPNPYVGAVGTICVGETRFEAPYFAVLEDHEGGAVAFRENELELIATREESSPALSDYELLEWAYELLMEDYRIMELDVEFYQTRYERAEGILRQLRRAFRVLNLDGQG